LQIGDIMRGSGVGKIIESKHPDYSVGMHVLGGFGWQEYSVSNGKNTPLRPVPEDVSLPATLGLFGTTGLTAYFGLLDLGEPKSGDTVVVSGAAGATGSVAGQIARIKGCRVIGIAGSADKCAWLKNKLNFDEVINYKTEDVGERLDALCPDGINVYFDNVGGDILDLALARIAHNARIVICGGISRYNKVDNGPVPGPVNYFNLVYRRARMEGFIVLDYAAQFEDAIREMRIWVKSGELKHAEDIVNGFENLPQALMRLFEGKNTGKQMVCVAED
ncbi:MAG: NADP-dependent oxidoreductase, partial [Pseudomonadota bacterium]